MNAFVNSFRVAGAGGQLMVSGDLCQRVTIGANAFFRTLPRLPSSRSLDLLMITVGAYAADRMILRHGRRSGRSGIRTFNLSFAVQDPAFWSQPNIKESVIDVLSFLTDDNWSVSFEQSTENWYQAVLPITWFAPGRIALFSEGLDSAAGLADQALKGSDGILLVTIGHYAALRRRAERQIAKLGELVPAASLQHAGLLVSLRGGVSRRLRQQEKTQRSRAFLFCAASIAAACACDVRDIEVFENGVGAINLPPMTGMLFGGLATRGAHPSLLAKMSALGSLVADRSIAFSLPYQDLTKGELVARLRGTELEDWLQQSRSCIHTSIRTAGISHCGICPGCMERRQAFTIAGIEENVSKYKVDIFRESLSREAREYLGVLVQDSDALLSDDSQALRRLNAHLCATEVNTAGHTRVRQLLRRNAYEVRRVFHIVQERQSGAYALANGSPAPLASTVGVPS